MKSSCVLAVSLLACASPAPAQTPHVRALDAVARLALARGVEESALFRALLDELDASNVIVHVTSSASLPRGVAGTMRFVGFVGDTRYIRVDIAMTSPPALRVATLAHELQHACEVARSPATTHETVRDLYRRIGSEVPGAHDAYETAAARFIGAEVLAELRGLRPTVRATEQ